MWNEFISRLDEIIGAGMLMSLAVVAMVMNYDHGLAQAAVAGIVALLAVGAAKRPGTGIEVQDKEKRRKEYDYR